MIDLIASRMVEGQNIPILFVQNKRIRTLPEHPGDSNAGGRDARRSQPRSNAEWSNQETKKRSVMQLLTKERRK